MQWSFCTKPIPFMNKTVSEIELRHRTLRLPHGEDAPLIGSKQHYREELKKWQKKLLHVQQAIYHQKKELPKTIAIRRDIYVAESDKDARKVQEFVNAKGYRGFDNDALIIGDASANRWQVKFRNTLSSRVEGIFQ